MMGWSPLFPKVTELPKERGADVLAGYLVRRAENTHQAFVDLRWILTLVIPCYVLVEARTDELDHAACSRNALHAPYFPRLIPSARMRLCRFVRSIPSARAAPDTFQLASSSARRM
jgi:hypothetical protein